MDQLDLIPSFQAFLAYRSAAEPWLFQDTTAFMNRCGTDFSAIISICPNVVNEGIHLCMAAWVALKYFLDDIVATMSIAEVKQAIQVVADMLHDFPNQSSPGETRRRRSLPAFARIRYHTTQFRLLISEYLGRTELAGLNGCIAEVLTGMSEVVNYREKQSRSSSDYLQIRARTTGLCPLFYLALLDETKDTGKASLELRFLQDLVSLATGLQDDLIRLEDDLSQKQTINYVLVASDNNKSYRSLPVSLQIPCLHGVVQSAILKHNSIVRDAVKQHDRIQSTMEMCDEWASADTALALITRHLSWTGKSRGYELRSGCQSSRIRSTRTDPYRSQVLPRLLQEIK
jgi:hypothetical protein